MGKKELGLGVAHEMICGRLGKATFPKKFERTRT